MARTGAQAAVEGRSVEQFEGNPRPPCEVPLERAAEHGILQVLDERGALREGVPEPEIPEPELLRMYEVMVLVRAIDERGWKLQRSGRVAFWIPIHGQEAAHVASAQAVRAEDWIFRGHRDLGAMLLRGVSLEQLFAQFFGRVSEPLKGRRLPCLVGDRAANIVSSTTAVGGYLPHASGAAWAARLKGHDTRVLVYFGEGSSSRGQFHSALNFASIHGLPLILLCENNGWAVSTPTNLNAAVENFAAKGEPYGVRNVRVDGNDFLAVYAAVREAHRLAAEGPTLIEAVTYRLGFHTSSDNPDLYRTDEEATRWSAWDPLRRARGYLESRGLWDEDREAGLWERCRQEIQAAVMAAEALPLPQPGTHFEDVFAEETWMLREQREQLLRELGEEAP